MSKQITITMTVSVPILAKDLKKELVSFGVKVLMCKQYQQNAILAIDSDVKNFNLFIEFCELNNYAGPCGLKFSGKPRVNIGNIYKYKTL